jgi:hypothetical protein
LKIHTFFGAVFLYWNLFLHSPESVTPTESFFLSNARDAIDAPLQADFHAHLCGGFYAFVIPRFFFSRFFQLEKTC